MYNLLILHSSTFNEWDLNEGRRYDASFLGGGGRLFEYTDEVIKQRFTLPNTSSPNFDALMKLPCLFTYEGRDVTGAIGRINRVTPRARGPELIYSLPAEYPRIRMNNDDIFASLGIDTSGYEWSRTHWAVKDIDLFEVATTMLHNSDQRTTLLPGHEVQRIWGPQHQQGKLVFLSHRARYRREVSEVKEALESRGLSCFLAHEDIRPSLSWQAEILNALNTMDVFVAFVTDDFHQNGGWPDQEIGYAHKRDVPRVFVKLGKADPAGMVTAEQALTADWADAAGRILDHLTSIGLLGPALS